MQLPVIVSIAFNKKKEKKENACFFSKEHVDQILVVFNNNYGLKNIIFSDSSLKMCRTGYHGNSCFEICPYPTFGKMCKGICKCIPHLCNHIHGCPTIGTC